jgi:hypothetical protein
MSQNGEQTAAQILALEFMVFLNIKMETFTV